MTVRSLPDDADLVEPEPFAGPDHPMRAVTRQVAFEGGWSPGRARKIAELFDGLAADWTATHSDAVRLAPVRDALRRGDADLDGRWLELGAGTGAATRVVAPEVPALIALELSAEMLANGPTGLTPQVRADSAQLPFAADSFDAVLLVNMLLFPHEIDRVLAPTGRLVWVNTLGDQTPIHLPPADVIAALPGKWEAKTARSGSGFWLTAYRV